jgi:hypothetical protein
VVSDRKRSVAFYRTLGIPFEIGAEESDHGHAEATLEHGLRCLMCHFSPRLEDVIVKQLACLDRPQHRPTRP